ncbi:MAG: 3'-5' exonuclease [Vampirovibrionales bacterium]|nr:3'-5' exonuclease [Vampirovibrionales bacterium]
MSQARLASQPVQAQEQVSLFAQTAQPSLFGSFAQQATDGQGTLACQLDEPLTQAVFTVMDLETTGLNAKRNAITEIAALQYRNGEMIKRFVTLVKPAEIIPEEIEQFTGITNEMVKSAPATVMALSDLGAFIGEQPIIVGHNIGFDINFVREKFQQNGLGLFADRTLLSRALCTKVLAQKIMPGLPSYEGIVVATSCGVINPNPHRAENDVKMSADILFALIQRLQEQNPGIRTARDLLAYQGVLG